jgi:putative pyruvate formate lyase activating enzyme
MAALASCLHPGGLEYASLVGRSSERFLVSDDFEPAYLALARSGALAERAREAVERLRECRLCPRACGARRLDDEHGTCQTGRLAVFGSAFAHMGEEDCLRGTRGSGTIFFAECNLHCVFCQNADLSHARDGEEARPEALAAIMLELARRGCHNVNLVTPSHVVPQILEALVIAAEHGLALPLVYNTSAYDTVETLRLLDGVIDVYMPDFKFWEEETARRLAAAPDYPERARAALAEMHRQAGVLKMGPDGTARRGVLIRHLVMPGQGEESAAILEWLARELSPDTHVNVMAQYRPAHRVGQQDADGQRRFADIARAPRPAEMEDAHDAARRAGLWRLDARWP